MPTVMPLYCGLRCFQCVSNTMRGHNSDVGCVCVRVEREFLVHIALPFLGMDKKS